MPKCTCIISRTVMRIRKLKKKSLLYNLFFTLHIGCFFNSVFYDLALILSFFGIFEIVRTFFHSVHRRIFKDVKTLLIEQILV